MEGIVRGARPGRVGESTSQARTEGMAVRGPFASHRTCAPGGSYDSTQLGSLCIERRTLPPACWPRRRPDTHYLGLLEGSLQHYVIRATASNRQPNGQAVPIDIMFTGDI